MGKCYFVSDLHLLAACSNADGYLEEIVRRASHAETFVLGGDIFDFRWSRMPMTRAAAAAARWLEELAAKCPRCGFHLVLGNHDHHQVFIDRLTRLEKQVHNLSWHEYYLRLGSSVFLHGDVINRRMNSQRLARSRRRCLTRGRRGELMHSLYNAVLRTGLHKPVPHLVYARRVVARRILQYLESIGQGPADGVRDVYFGHTHRRLSDYRYRGLAFHNCGAGIKGVRLRILEARR